MADKMDTKAMEVGSLISRMMSGVLQGQRRWLYEELRTLRIAVEEVQEQGEHDADCWKSPCWCGAAADLNAIGARVAALMKQIRAGQEGDAWGEQAVATPVPVKRRARAAGTVSMPRQRAGGAAAGEEPAEVEEAPAEVAKGTAVLKAAATVLLPGRGVERGGDEAAP